MPKLEYKWTRGKVFRVGDLPPAPEPPEGDDWHLASTMSVTLTTADIRLPYFCWVRAGERRTEPCSGFPGRTCGSIAVVAGRCLGCGKERG